MAHALSFRFVDNNLNRCLISLFKKRQIKHSLGKDGTVFFSAADEELVENELIGSIRTRVFPSWQVLSCPKDWTDLYKQYMRRREIPFTEELANSEFWFLIPRKYRPDSWKLHEVELAK